MPSIVFSCIYFFSSSIFRYFFGFFLLFFLQLWNTWQGVGKTYDSFHYLEAAQSLVENAGSINSQSYMTWALGFPFLLTVFKDSAVLNLLCILGTYTFYFSLSEKLFENITTKWWLILAFALGTPLYLLHHFVWSEPPFVLFLVGSIWSFYFANKSCLSKTYIFLLCLFGFLFMSMRNAGLYFVAAINLGIGFFYLLPSIKKQENIILSTLKNRYFLISILFSVCCSVSILSWWLRAKPTTAGKFATMYSLAERTQTEEFINYGDILSRWLVPPAITLEIRLVLLVIFLVLCWIVFFKSILDRKNRNHITQFITFLLWIVSFYLVGMLITRTGMKVDAERYLAVLYPFLCILGGFIIEKLKVNHLLKYGIAFLWLIYPLLRTLKNITFWN